MLEILIFCLVGMVAGFLAGFLGIGGGVVVIPALLAYFSQFHPLQEPMRITVATTLASLTGSALVASLTHKRKGGLLSGSFIALVPSGILGSLLGVLLTVSIPEFFIKILFAGFEVFIGIHFWRSSRHIPQAYKTPSKTILALIAFSISIISAMLGIGGGVFTVPLLVYLGVEMKKAIGTSSTLTLIVLASGALGFFILGFFSEMRQPGLWGDIYYPAIPPIFIGSVLFAPIGAHLAHKTPSFFAKRVFGSFLVITGFYLGYSALLKVL